MPIFEYQGKKYNVKDEHIDNFAKEYPEATSIQERDNKKYRVKSSDYKTFMSESVQSQTSEQPTESADAAIPARKKPWKPTGQEKERIDAQMEQMRRSTQRTVSKFNEGMENLREYREKSPLGNQAVESSLRFNPQTGKLERTYLTPLGNRYGDKGMADFESFRYRQAADMSVGGQLRRANQRLRELQEKRAERAIEVHSEWAQDFEKNKAPLAAVLAANTYVARQQSDRKNSALDVAIRETEELIKNLEEQRDRENGVDVGFWRGFGRTVGDVRTWDFGMGGMRDALTKMNAKDLQGENATEGEKEAYHSMMGAIHEREKADEMYGGNASFWNRAGVMTGYMPSFMLDFIITGGGYSGLNAAGKVSTKLATKVVGEQAIKEMAEQGFKNYVKNYGVKGFGREASNWTIKALGTTADDLLVRAPLMTNTVQIGKTASDIIDRKLGNVVVGENGNYEFANDSTWGNAIWRGEANAIIENYSEMFGAHLDPVMSLGNMSKLANVIGAKRIGNVLAKADASALSGIMGQTQALFNKMGVSDYVGEVSEEYYGQLWRTMLNLDDAYQQNPDGSRTNLFLSGQFHGDIWGGMALSMGLMGAGKHTLTAVDYMSAKHRVNKADTKAKELLGAEVWEPMKSTIDLTTNDDIGKIADNIVKDSDLTNEEKTAVLDYMERSLYMRGFNLATMAKSRNGNHNEVIQQADESYINGYSVNSPQEMNDTKNLYEYHRHHISNMVSEETLSMIDSNPVETLARINSSEISNSERDAIIDYINSKQVYDGMMQRIRDDLDGRIGQSNAMVDSRVNRTTGRIQDATMKLDNRKVYIIIGNLALYDDGTGIDLSKSDSSIIVRDAETGSLEQVSPDAILSIDAPQDPTEQKEIAANTIREQYAQEAANKIDGIVTFNPGDTYTISGDDGSMANVQIVANENGIVDNGDGTVNVTDGTNVFPIQKELIQQQVDAQNIARVADFEKNRIAENNAEEQAAWEATKPQYVLNDLVTLQDGNGNIINGQIADYNEADDMFVVDVDSPIDGKYAPNMSREQLDNMVVSYNGQTVRKPTSINPSDQQNQHKGSTQTTESQIEEKGNTTDQTVQEETAPQLSAFDRIEKDAKGQPLYEKADSDTAWDAIVEQTDGDETMAHNVAASMLADKEAELKKIEKMKPKGGISVAEKIAAERERKAAIEQAKQQVDIWKRIADTPERRKANIEAERRRQAEEAAALRKAETERLRAEREEAERNEREALNGVPDVVDDTPKDARARGYRRVSGHKIDRQEPLQAVRGKEVSVKFSDNTIPEGHIAVIDASQLQPSHIAGMRNYLHFIDEAQPKERIDDASVLSAQKIAGNIRPEEITSSVTAYTGAPTVNARGEVIQGNNRGAALRIMWDGYKEQAEKYRQYLIEHAQDFGIAPEDIAKMDKPVLVNMLDVDDDSAITLGQYVAQDTESGGTERIKPKNALQRMGGDMRIFANLLLKSTDDDTSFSGLVDRNGFEVLRWMQQKGYITPTQYMSALDGKGNITAEAKNDLRGIMYQSIFKDGSTRLDEMFSLMPAKAQRAILATAYRDYDSPTEERMIGEIQNSIRAYHALSQSTGFADAKTDKDARLAVEAWKIQYQIDDVTGESYLPADKFSNFALMLATMYKGENQSVIQGTFNKLYDLIQGTREANLFEQPDNTPRSLAQAIYETLNIIYDGQRRSDVLVGDNSTSQRGQQGSQGDAATGERIESGKRAADSAGSLETESRSGSEAVHQSRPDSYDEQRRSTVLGEDNLPSRQGQQESLGDAAAGGRIESGKRAADLERGIETESLAGGASVHQPRPGRKGFEQDSDGGRQGDGTGMADDSTRSVEGNRDGSDLRVFEEGLDASYRTYSDDSERTRREAESERLVNIAKRNGLFIPAGAAGDLASKILKRTGESVVYIDRQAGKVIKVKDPYAKSAMKSGVQPEDAVFEHLVHNLLFPETAYTLEGISEEMGDVRIVLSQKLIQNPKQPTKEQIAEALAARGLFPEDNYSFGNELVSVTDIEGDNALLGEDGRVYFIDPIIRFKKPLREIIATITEKQTSPIGVQMQTAEAEVNTNPTEKQKEAGNYRKGHVRIDGFNVTIENPKGSIRSGVDATGKEWSITMNNTYGYMRGTQGVDGDHIDVFLSDNPDNGNVYIVDQINQETGEFDEHKVMYGFNSMEEAKEAYLSNYSEGWKIGNVTEVSKEEFKKWVNSSHRKTKPFAEYSSIKTISGESGDAVTDNLTPNTETTAIQGFDGYSQSEIKSIVQEYIQQKLDENDISANVVGIAIHGSRGRGNAKENSDLDVVVEYEGDIREDGMFNLLNDDDNGEALYIEGIRVDINPIRAQETGTLDKYMERSRKYDEEVLAKERNTDKEKGYTVERRFHEKNGTYIHAVKFTEQMPRERFMELKKRVKDFGGYYSSFGKGGFIFNTEADAQKFAEAVLDKSGELLDDAEPVSIADLRESSTPSQTKQVDVESLMQAIRENGEAKLSDHVIKEKPHDGQPASSDRDRQDLTTGSTVDPDAVQTAKIQINKLSAKHELNNIVHKYVGKRTTRGFIKELASALGDHSGKPKQSYYFGFTDNSGIEYTLRLSNHNVNGENAGDNEKEISIVIKSRRQPNRFVAGNAEVTEYVYFKEAIAQGDGQTLAWIAQDLADMLDTGIYADRSGIAIVNRNPAPTDANRAETKPSKKQNPSGNKLVSDERYEELKRRMKAKLGQLNVGIDPEILAIGTEMAVYHIEKGARKFAEYAKAMISDLGDVVRPYLKSFYNGARDLPEVIDSGMANDMTPYDDVRIFDIANFDKGHIDPFATAENTVAEQKIGHQAEEVKKEIISKRNSERRKENEQTTADTEVIASQAEAIASQAESDIEAATDERQINEIAANIDTQIEGVNKQLALLGYYEADFDDKYFNEAYGYMRSAEKKAVKDANNLAKRLVKDLGIKPELLVDGKGKKLNSFASANIAPAGGDVTITLPLMNGRELKVYVSLEPTSAERGEDYIHSRRGDNLYIEHIMYRVENPSASGYERYGINRWIHTDADYEYILQLLKYEARDFLPKDEVKSAELKSFNDYKVGEKVLYTPSQRSGEPVEAIIHDFEDYGEHRPVLDTGLSPVLYEVVDWGDIKPITQKETTEKPSKTGKKSISSQKKIADLFGGLFNNENLTGKEEKNGLRRNDEVSSERLSADSDRHEERLSEGSESGSDVKTEGSQRIDSGRERGSYAVDRTVRPRSSGSVTTPKNTHNNHSDRGVNHAPTSVDARIDANIKAVELANQLIENGETATPEQMAILRKFSGWGGLGKAFNDANISQRLQEILGAEGYEQAVMSANSAYYTPAYVVDTLWDIAEQMGFEGGNILEGSAGIGNILGQMPTQISERSDIHAIEIDRTSGGILSLLYPDAKVEIQGFEQTRIPNGSVDLAITNVPFVTGLRVDDTTGDKDLSKKFHNIHDFCIAKNVRKLREGGIGIFISSNGTLDNSKKLRDWIVNEGGSDFVGAFRMNNKTFGGTSVTSDIIVIRKRVNGRKSPHAIDVSTISGERTAEYDTGETRKVKGVEVPVIKQLAMDYNRYFIEHPENMAGTMRFAFEEGETFRPTSKGLYPTKGKDQEKMLADFVNGFSGKDWKEETSESASSDSNDFVADASADGRKVGEMYVKDGNLVIASLGGFYPLEVNANKVKGHTKVECFNAYSAIKEALTDVLEYQTNNESDSGLKPLLDRLNKAYDDFVSTYGHFNKNTAIAFLRNDVDYPNVFSLERYEEVGDKSGKRVQKFGKTDVFSKRVVEKEKEPTPTNIKDGIIASVFKFGRIDIPYIASQLGESQEDVRRDIIENRYGFEDPATRQIEVSYLYLSGNVREKLRQAQENNENGRYDGNIKALQEVLPMDIPAHLIDFTLGSSWIDPKLYEEYVLERTEIPVSFTPAGGTWFMSAPDYGLNKEKNRSMGVVSEMLHKTIFGHTLIEAAIQNRTITVSQTNRKWDGTTETITDKEATQACAAKIDEIRLDFKEWARQKMQSDSDMSARMERVYNDTFNNYVPMSIPEEFVPEYFGGASHRFKMRPHQGKAIVRGTMQPLMLAHEVGTGKTFTLISTAMEMRRLGTARKPMIVVQNATVGQFVASAKELYPNAKILTLEESDRSAEGRKNFYAKIRYNDWDMIVVPQSTFEFIPDSEERQMAYIQDKIEEKKLVLEQMRDADPSGQSMITRQAQREIDQLEEQLAGIADEASKKRNAADQKKRAVSLQNAEVRAKEMLDRRTDDVENFDDMGIDALLVDEAHEYKHLGFATAMQRGVKGVDPSYSKKSQGVYLKTQAVLEKNNGRNVIFATGTPISNTAAEIWTFMRYLMPADTMSEYGIYYFDDFVRNFGNIQQMLEFTTSGKFKENNRFAGYVNLPELVRIWSGVSDTVLTREAGGVSDKIPDMEGGKAQDIYLPQTRALRGIMKFVKAQLDRYEKMSGKEKKENSHIPLTMYGIAKAAAVDARLVQADAEDDPNSKTNEAVRQTLRSLKETESYKGTVAIFADNYQNKQSGFNLYDDIRDKLIAEGIPAEQVVIMRSGMTIKKKLEIFDKVNRGEIRVILGSTFTLGTGVNIQERLHTLIHLDAPNRPMDYTQRNGRILRQGNLHKSMGKPVRILRFGVEDSLDVTAYQRLKTKGAIADSIMDGKRMMANSMSNRVLEEEEDVFGDTVAQLSGSEYALLKNNAEKNVRKYEIRKKQWEVDQTYIHNAKPKLKALIEKLDQTAKEQKAYLEAIRKAFPDGTFSEITVGKHSYPSVESMADYIKEHNKAILDEVKKIKESGNTAGQTRNLTISLGGYTFKVQTVLSSETTRGGGQLFTEVHRKMTYSCPELGLSDVPVHQSLLRNAIDDIINNVITGKDFAERIAAAERSAAHNRSELEQLESREGKPFEYQKELEQARGQLQEYTEAMRKEMAEKEAKYAEMDASVETASNITIEDDDDVMLRDSDTMYRIRESEPPTKTGIGYKVFVLRDGKLYPPMVANPGGAETPVGVWLDADAAPIAGQSKTGRNQVKAGGKGTQGGSGKLAYRPGWHLGEIPYALQFNRLNPETGEKELFPANFVWAEVEYADDVDYQEEAMSYGINPSGKFQHSLAGLPRVPQNGSYRYRTNPNPDTDPWIITGAMRVNRLLTPTEVDEMVTKAGREPQQRQFDAVTDEEINSLNKLYQLADEMTSVNPRAERREMSERVKELAEKLHLDNVEVVMTVSGLDGKKAHAKGFYTKSTGKITIVIPNNRNVADAVQTLLHEAVAHYGLRKMFGTHFDTFLDNVFNNADDDVRRRIVDIAKNHDWNFRKATEEYLAGLAERTEFEKVKRSSWWQKIKNFFAQMLNKIGLPGFNGITISDNELRYILWRSYENLKGNSLEDVLIEAADIAKQYELEVGEFAKSDDTMFREGDPEVHERILARDRYEQRVRSGMYQSQEALQDSMLGLKEAMESILKGEGKKRVYIEDVDGFENAYLGENRLSSVNKAEADAFARLLFKPMLDEVAKLAPTKAAREELTDYMMAKHGLERNTVMAERDAKAEYEKRQKEHPNSKLTLQDFIDKFRERDYAGLTALTGYNDVSSAEAEAQQIVDDYESAHDPADLWKKVNAVSKAILQKSYECGMMSKATYDSISDMYEFYIPLRGFDEKTSAEAYSYLAHKQSAFNAPIKKAEGRRSKADDPFANLQSMAESAIMQGNRNKLVKQRFLNFALNHPSDLVSISDLWVQYDDVVDEWRPVFPDNIEIDDTPKEVEQKMLDFDEKMKQLAEINPELYKHGKDAVNIPYRVIDNRDLRQHQVVVKRGGRDYVITINGNPRAAQALNGQTNPDNDNSGVIGSVLRAGEKLNRQLSAFYTTRNPDFIVSNFMRDMLYTNTMAWIKESPNYALRFHRNYIKMNPAMMKKLLAKYRTGSLDMGDKTESMFYQFMMNGGETGYANIRDVDQHKNDIRRELKKASGGKISVRKAWSLLGERFDELNRAIENCARFAAYMTSREMGRSLDRSIYDAKEISVNFNKKGSGAKFYDTAGQTKSGNAAAFVSGLGRSAYVFWNAAIQGTANFGKQAQRHPAKAFTGAAVMFLLGAIIAYLGGDDDDDDKNAYYNLPEYVRRSNILFRIGDSWISIPLPVEYRALYGMGELMTSVLNGKEHFTGGELAEQIAAQMSQIMPLDLMNDGGLMGLVPSSIKPFAEVHENKSWTGLPIYKDTPWNKDMPEWTKAYKSANRELVNLAAVLNEISGGDAYTKGAIDINPAKIEHILEGYFGGVASTIDKMTKTVETVVGTREYDPRSILFVNRLVKAGDERTEYRAVNNEYFRLKEEHDRIGTRLRNYENDTDNGIFDYAEKIDFLYNSPEYERWEIFEFYKDDIDDLYEELKEAVDDDERKDIERELNEIKKEMISEMNLTRKRK